MAKKKATRKKATKSSRANSAKTSAGEMSERLERKRVQDLERSRERSQAGTEIGGIPAVVDQARRDRCRESFRDFCEEYFPDSFPLAWSADHLRAIEKIERAVVHGELFAFAMPRGSGKTTLSEAGALWAIVYGFHQYVALIGADESSALELLSSLKMELETNERLLDDFPEVCFPIQALEGESRRCARQTCNGEKTFIKWGAKEFVFPTIKGSVASAAKVSVAGITGRIRGMKYKRADGTNARPTLVIVDDFQTDESAKSPPQCEQRLRILNGAILGLAGPGKKIAGVAPCTIIRQGDAADELLDRDKSPDWNGERARLVYEWPKDSKLWAEYAKLRAEGLKNGDGGKAATAFYKKNRKKMDAGAVVGWPERYDKRTELSAIQHAINLKLRDEASFAAEYQNDPLVDETTTDALDADEVAARLSGLARRVVPLWATKLTAFVDVQGKALYFVVAAWADDFTGSVIDYGTWPDQDVDYFTLKKITRTIQRAKPGAGREAGLLHACQMLIDGDLMPREYRREDGVALRIDRALVDANWGDSTDIVYQFCRTSKFAGVVLPSHGRYIGASSKELNDVAKSTTRKTGDLVGDHWRISSSAKSKRASRYVVYDTNYKKTFVASRLTTPVGDPGSLSLYGRRAIDHRMISEHFASEYPVETTGRGRTVSEWKLRPGIADNHFWDGVVGCAVAASIEGVRLGAMADASPARKSAKTATARKNKTNKRRGRGGRVIT